MIWYKKLISFISILAMILSILPCLAGCVSYSGVSDIPQPTAEAESPVISETAERSFKGELIISEVMTKNSAYTMDDNGAFPDWLELCNISDSPIELEGFVVSDGSSRWTMPACTLEAGEFKLVFADGTNSVGKEWHTDFSLGSDEMVSLFSPSGDLICTAACSECGSAHSDIFRFDGGTELVGEVSNYPTPGYPNDDDGYSRYLKSLAQPNVLRINEVYVDGSDALGTYDWIELYNAGQQSVLLSDYRLSDNINVPDAYILPELELAPGEYYVVECESKDELSAGFSLSRDGDCVFLYNGGALIDYTHVRDLPNGGSFGRSASGIWCFYSQPSKLAENTLGAEKIAEAPVSLEPDGVVDEVEYVSVELAGEGTIYYTTDCTEPDENSSVYTAPIVLTQTTVVKAVCIAPGKLKSPVTVLSYIINENETLPVLSLVASAPDEMDYILNRTVREDEIGATISMYENGEKKFSIGCGVYIYGHSSMRQPNKSIKLRFRSAYGSSSLNYDVFGNGINIYNSLSLRKGEDAFSMIFRNELWQDICGDISSSMLTLESCFCVLYVDGEYYGICALQEDNSSQYVASHTGGSKESSEKMVFPLFLNPMFETSEFFLDVIRFAAYNSRLTDENYELLCSRVNIDSFIDWIIIESYSGNMDISYNVEFVRSDGTGGKWEVVLFDLDRTFQIPARSVFGYFVYSSEDLMPLISSLFSNQKFIDRFTSRFAQVCEIITNERIVKHMEQYYHLLDSSVNKDFSNWGQDPSAWRKLVESEKNNIIESDWRMRVINAVCGYSGISVSDIILNQNP